MISFLYHSKETEKTILGIRLDEKNDVIEDSLFGHGIKISSINFTPLRYLLFKDKKVELLLTDKSIKQTEYISEEWVKSLKNRYKMLLSKKLDKPKKDPQENDSNDNGDHVFDFLKKITYGSFIQAIQLLRSIEVDALSNRRWTSRFLVPRGKYLIYSDIDDRNMSIDRRFFGRGGEIIFLMLYRSNEKIKKELAKQIERLFFTTSEADTFNQIAEKFIDKKEFESDKKENKKEPLAIAYLSVIKHSSFDQLAIDWLSILNLEALNISQKFSPLFRITALNLIRYISERSQSQIEQKSLEKIRLDEPMPLDATNGNSSDMVSLSKIYLSRIKQMVLEAVKVYIESKIDEYYEQKTKSLKEFLLSKYQLSFNSHHTKLISIKMDYYFYSIHSKKDVFLKYFKEHLEDFFHINIHQDDFLEITKVIEETYHKEKTEYLNMLKRLIDNGIDVKPNKKQYNIRIDYHQAIDDLSSSLRSILNLEISDDLVKEIFLCIDRDQFTFEHLLLKLQKYHIKVEELDIQTKKEIENIIQHHAQQKLVNSLNFVLETQFHINLSNPDIKIFEILGNTYEDRITYFIEKVQTRSRNNISGLIEPLGKDIGLINQRSGIGSWLSCSDDLLETLVLTQVKETITLSDFLSKLYDQYKIVIGPVEATKTFKNLPCDISSFEINLHSLEKRLIGLGYVKRLSDDCAFISNPHYAE
jgi:hypothetical protein